VSGGVAADTLFVQLRHKQALLEACLEEQLEKVLDHAFATAPGGDVVSELVYVASRLFERSAADPRLARVVSKGSVFRAPDDEQESVLGSQLARYGRWLQERLELAASRGAARDAAETACIFLTGGAVMSFAGKVLVVGGGIEGLAVTRGLLQQGAEVTLIGRAPAFTPAGAGIVLAANALAVLDALGIDVAAKSQAPPGVSIANARGEPLQTARADLLQTGYQTLYALHRADLHEALLAETAGASLKMGRTVESLTGDGESASVSAPRTALRSASNSLPRRSTRC
jgi:hypothetical protein